MRTCTCECHKDVPTNNNNNSSNNANHTPNDTNKNLAPIIADAPKKSTSSSKELSAVPQSSPIPLNTLGNNQEPMMKPNDNNKKTSKESSPYNLSINLDSNRGNSNHNNKLNESIKLTIPNAFSSESNKSFKLNDSFAKSYKNTEGNNGLSSSIVLNNNHQENNQMKPDDITFQLTNNHNTEQIKSQETDNFNALKASSKSLIKTSLKKSKLSQLKPPKEDEPTSTTARVRYSKFSSMILPVEEATKKEEDGLDSKRGSSNTSKLNNSLYKREGNAVIRFRTKSKEKKQKRAQEDKLTVEEEKLEKEKKLRTSLGNKLKAQFDKIKLKDLKTPDKLDNHVDEKFIRDKSGVTKEMEKLTREIRGEHYNDSNKLQKNIFEDFEKQESWQSYTTLLFADLSKKEDIEKEKLTLNSTTKK